MNDTYEKSYVEVLEILKHIPKKEYDMIPKEKIDFYKANSDKTYKYVYSSQITSRKTYSIIVSLYKNYIATNEKKLKIDNLLRKNLKKEEIKKEEKYNPNDLFKNKKVNTVTPNSNLPVQLKNKSIISRIIERIKKLIHCY